MTKLMGNLPGWSKHPDTLKARPAIDASGVLPSELETDIGMGECADRDAPTANAIFFQDQTLGLRR